MINLVVSKTEAEMDCAVDSHGAGSAMVGSYKLIRRGPSRLAVWIVVVLSLCMICYVAVSSFVMINFKDNVQVVLRAGEFTWVCAITTWFPTVVYFLLPCILVWGVVKVYEQYVSYRLRIGEQINSRVVKEMESQQSIDTALIKIISNVFKTTEEGTRTERKTDYLMTIKKEVPVGDE